MTQASNTLYHGYVSGPQEALSLRLIALQQEKEWCEANGYTEVPIVDASLSAAKAMSEEMDRRIQECISTLVEEWLTSENEEIREVAESLRDEDWTSLAV